MLTKRKLNGIIFSQYLSYPLKNYLFLVKKTLKRLRLIKKIQIHQVNPNNNKAILAVFKIIQNKNINFFYAHAELAFEFKITAKTAEEKLIKRLRFINFYNTLLFRVLSFLQKEQRNYLSSGRVLDLRPITQEFMAKKLKVDNSWISRLIRGKKILIPNGKSILLRFLFPSKKQCLLFRFQEVHENELSLLKKQKLSAAHNDSELQKLLFLKHKQRVSIRNICHYRHELQIQNFHKRYREDLGLKINFSPDYNLTKFTLKKHLHHKPGVYILKVGKQAIYVGSSSNLYKRIRTHLTESSRNSKLRMHIKTNKCTFCFAIVKHFWRETERQLFRYFAGSMNYSLLNTISP